LNDSFAGVDISGMDDQPNDWGKWLIHGPQGSGKTTLASTIAELGPTLFIDLTGERGIRSFRNAPYSKNIRVARPKSVTALDDIFWKLAEPGHPFKAVVIDSLTAVQKMTMRFLLNHDETAVREIRQGTAPADQRTWGQSLDVMQDTATFWYELASGERDNPMHVIMTAQTKITEDFETGDVRRIPDVQKGALSIVLATPDYIVYTDVEQNMDSIGDDTGSEPPVHHIVRFGADPDYRIKARLPYNLRGKIPPILGRKRPTSLVDLSRVLGVGGVPPKVRAPRPTSEEQNR
jgi:energy-coupling factor transporter ATP-binding protein EcfA2